MNRQITDQCKPSFLAVSSHVIIAYCTERRLGSTRSKAAFNWVMDKKEESELGEKSRVHQEKPTPATVISATVNVLNAAKRR